MRQLSSGRKQEAQMITLIVSALTRLCRGDVANPARCGSDFLMRLPTCSPIMRSDGSGQVLTCQGGPAARETP
jgi:hypothetical protein